MTNSDLKSTISNEEVVDYNAVRKDLLKIMNNPDHDDGSIGPILIRLAWHSSGTYDQDSNREGKWHLKYRWRCGQFPCAFNAL